MGFVPHPSLCSGSHQGGHHEILDTGFSISGATAVRPAGTLHLSCPVTSISPAGRQSPSAADERG